MKSLYYCRSQSIQRADTVSQKAVRPVEFVMAEDMSVPAVPLTAGVTDYEECLACQ